MQSVLIVIHILIVVALIAVVLLQRSEGGALGAGGGTGSFMTGRGQANALSRATAILGAMFASDVDPVKLEPRSPLDPREDRRPRAGGPDCAGPDLARQYSRSAEADGGRVEHAGGARAGSRRPRPGGAPAQTLKT